MNDTKKFSILVVDDEKSNIMALMDILRSEYTIYAATNGKNAVESAEKHLPDIILLDIIMSDLDGYEVITTLKASEKTKDIPVIFITGLSSAKDEEKGLAFGVADYIIKPFSPAIVKLRVRNQIKLIEQLRANEYDIMKYKLSNNALEIAMWDMDVVSGDPVNPNNRIAYSQEFRNMMGFSDETDFPNELGSWSERLHPEDKEKTVNAFAAHMNDRTDQTPYNVEYRALMKNNSEYRYFHSLGNTFRDSSGIPLRVAGALRDITEIKQMEEEARKTQTAELANRAKSEFLAKMSHEIRTPMNSIMGFAELALDSDNLSQIKEYLGKITDSTGWLLRIINDILDISKIESGKMELEKVPFSLHEIFLRCQSVILPNVKEKGLDLSVYTEPPIGKKLLGDPVRLYQVLMNLLSNAVKFTDSGKIKFSSLIKSSNNGNTTVYFEVKDNGIGMSKEQIEKVFDPFIQADSSTTRNYGGTGLGLAIVKNIVELMGGTLSVESSPGEGSIFKFEITFDTIDVPEDMEEEPEFIFLGKPQFDAFVLICDDNPMNQEVICEHLSRLGIKTAVADNGKKGVDMVQERITKNEKLFDLIFMDMFMPVMDGMEAASEIRKISVNIPIVAMTANIMASELEKYRNNGMPDCLSKPFTSHELWRILLKYLVPVELEPPQENDAGIPDLVYFENILQEKLRTNFVKSNQTRYMEITEAIESGNYIFAHRLVHSLKGNAGMIGKTALQNAAAKVEALLKDSLIPVPQEDMKTLETELKSVLEELKYLLEKSSTQEKPQPMSDANILDLIKKIEPMLANIDPVVVNLLDDIRAIPDTEDLARQIEDYNFEAAAQTLSDLKKKYGENNV